MPTLDGSPDSKQLEADLSEIPTMAHDATKFTPDFVPLYHLPQLVKNADPAKFKKTLIDDVST